ncbi:MAG TPA: hypothetical protein VH207_06060 [Chthoniobacterales bacterium]|nr:hypothetical protein [Chthoniobacterales bacterium]
MLTRLKQRSFSLGRFGLAAFLSLTIIAAAVLSASPGLHEHLHPDSGSTHLCLVTLFAAGQCEAATAGPVSAAPDAFPFLTTLSLPPVALLPGRCFFSLLEHAPPALA